jgi:DNA mismatch repair protein MutL
MSAAELETPRISQGTRRKIHILPQEEARKIAAGEVVDRPAALVREFMDNAIDAGGTLIETIIEGGGIRRTEVTDNGGGMEREDLEWCWYTHATSKIRTVEDLSTVETLGFRGEALAAAAAVSRLEILTSTDGRDAWRLEVGPGEGKPRLEQTRRAKGTSVRALGLFDAIPARKRFLKREGTEGGLCRQVFIDKALAFPGISFRFTQEGSLKLFLPAASSLKERYAAVLLSRQEGTFLHEINTQGPGFSAVIVIGGPELFRRDRRQQYVFANGRRIQDYSLLQALEYGVQGWFPNGTHPIGAVYVDIDPALADFNIHPAKREVRFRDPGIIHHAVTTALGDFTHHRNTAAGVRQAAPKQGEFPDPRPFPGEAFRSPGGGNPSRNGGFDRIRGFDGPGSSLAIEALLEKPPDFSPLPGRGRFPQGVADAVPRYGDSPDSAPSPASPRLAGRLFGLFILIEWGNRFFIIDQHAAHERILYNRFLSGPIPRQDLLVPIPFSTESAEDDRFLGERREELAKLGIVIAGGQGAWRVEALPVNWKLGDHETVREILGLKEAGEHIAEHWAATLSCHGAVKDGDYLDDTAALALAEEAIALPLPRCPHGRPIWFELSREALFKAVRRL